MIPVELSVQGLVLSAPTDADVDAIHAACQDPLIQRYTTVPSPYQRHDAEGFVVLSRKWWAEDGETTWAIRSGGRLTGMIGLHPIEAGAREIGFWMAPEHRGRGLLRRAGELVVDWGFAETGLALDRIQWRAAVGNEASARAAQRLGFRYEGLARHVLPGPHGREDGWLAGLLAGDDRAPRAWPILR